MSEGTFAEHHSLLQMSSQAPPNAVPEDDDTELYFELEEVLDGMFESFAILLSGEPQNPSTTRQPWRSRGSPASKWDLDVIEVARPFALSLKKLLQPHIDKGREEFVSILRALISTA